MFMQYRMQTTKWFGVARNKHVVISTVIRFLHDAPIVRSETEISLYSCSHPKHWVLSLFAFARRKEVRIVTQTTHENIILNKTHFEAPHSEDVWGCGGGARYSLKLGTR
jgi:hypothetical protein